MSGNERVCERAWIVWTNEMSDSEWERATLIEWLALIEWLLGKERTSVSVCVWMMSAVCTRTCVHDLNEMKMSEYDRMDGTESERVCASEFEWWRVFRSMCACMFGCMNERMSLKWMEKSARVWVCAYECLTSTRMCVHDRMNWKRETAKEWKHGNGEWTSASVSVNEMKKREYERIDALNECECECDRINVDCYSKHVCMREIWLNEWKRRVNECECEHDRMSGMRLDWEWNARQNELMLLLLFHFILLISKMMNEHDMFYQNRGTLISAWIVAGGIV